MMTSLPVVVLGPDGGQGHMFMLGRLRRMLRTSVPLAPPASSAAARAVMRGNRKFDTRPEAAVRSALHRGGLRFRKHARPLPTLNCAADIVFRRERLAVFIDGCYWHGCPQHGTKPRTNAAYWTAKIARNIERDQRNDAALRDAGWLVVRVWEHEDPEQAAGQILYLVRTRRGNARL